MCPRPRTRRRTPAGSSLQYRARCPMSSLPPEACGCCRPRAEVRARGLVGRARHHRPGSARQRLARPHPRHRYRAGRRPGPPPRPLPRLRPLLPRPRLPRPPRRGVRHLPPLRLRRPPPHGPPPPHGRPPPPGRPLRLAWPPPPGRPLRLRRQFPRPPPPGRPLRLRRRFPRRSLFRLVLVSRALLPRAPPMPRARPLLRLRHAWPGATCSPGIPGPMRRRTPGSRSRSCTRAVLPPRTWARKRCAPPAPG
jgi:hypothetical protein